MIIYHTIGVYLMAGRGGTLRPVSQFLPCFLIIFIFLSVFLIFFTHPGKSSGQNLCKSGLIDQAREAIDGLWLVTG